MDRIALAPIGQPTELMKKTLAYELKDLRMEVAVEEKPELESEHWKFQQEYHKFIVNDYFPKFWWRSRTAELTFRYDSEEYSITLDPKPCQIRPYDPEKPYMWLDTQFTTRGNAGYEFSMRDTPYHARGLYWKYGNGQDFPASTELGDTTTSVDSSDQREHDLRQEALAQLPEGDFIMGQYFNNISVEGILEKIEVDFYAKHTLESVKRKFIQPIGLGLCARVHSGKENHDDFNVDELTLNLQSVSFLRSQLQMPILEGPLDCNHHKPKVPFEFFQGEMYRMLRKGDFGTDFNLDDVLEERIIKELNALLDEYHRPESDYTRGKLELLSFKFKTDSRRRLAIAETN